MAMSPIYLSLRLLAWIGAATVQGIRIGAFASSQSSVPSITYMIAGNTCLFAVRDLLLLIHDSEQFDKNTPPIPLDLLLSFLNGLVDSCFMAILLFISSGYCITTHILRELPKYTIFLPVAYCVASVTLAWLPVLVDLSLESSGWEWQLAIAAFFVQAVITVMAWMAVIENSENIAKQLDEMAPRTAQEEAEAGSQFSISDSLEDGPDGFQVVAEHVTTIAEEVERAQQATLMRRFKIAVTVYMIAFVAAFFVPVYGKDKDESQVILALWNALLLLFMLTLAWVFRTRDEANPYLYVGQDEAQNVHLDTRIELQGMPVIPEEGPGSPDSTMRGAGKDGTATSAVAEPASPSAQPGTPGSARSGGTPNGKAVKRLPDDPDGKPAQKDDCKVD
eukprot:jgi/Ulvmu1/10517/UM064_0055.1